MTLREYINSVGISVKDFSQKVGVIPTTIYRYMDGSRKPRPEIAMKIVSVSNKLVSLESLYNIDVA